MRHDIGDLLGHQEEPEGWGQDGGWGQESEWTQVKPEKTHKHKKKGKKAKKEVDDGPPLISFDDNEPIPAAQPSVLDKGDSPPHKARGQSAKVTKGGGYGAMGYGSTGLGTNSSSSSSAKKADDWSGDWGEDWGGMGKSGAGKTEGSGWDEDWSQQGGWSSIDLKKD